MASLSTGTRDICRNKISMGHSIFLTWGNMSSTEREREQGLWLSNSFSPKCTALFLSQITPLVNKPLLQAESDTVLHQRYLTVKCWRIFSIKGLSCCGGRTQSGFSFTSHGSISALTLHQWLRLSFVNTKWKKLPQCFLAVTLMAGSNLQAK